jgi:hypothetical protein
MTDQTTPETAVWIDGDPLMEGLASAVWEHCDTDERSTVRDDPRNIAAVAAAVVRAQQPATVPPAVDRAAELEQAVRRLGLMVDEYGAGASALTDKLKRARDLHRETCPFAKGEAPPTAFTCGMCEVLDQPAAVLPAPADRAEWDALASETDRLRKAWGEMRDRAERIEAEVQRLTADRAAVLREAADAIDAAFTGRDLDRYTRYGADLLRRMAAEPPQPESPVHAVPVPGSNGISSCCGRPPCEFVGERVTRDPDAVTCQGAPAVVAQPDGEA